MEIGHGAGLSVTVGSVPANLHLSSKGLFFMFELNCLRQRALSTLAEVMIAILKRELADVSTNFELRWLSPMCFVSTLRFSSFPPPSPPPPPPLSFHLFCYFLLFRFFPFSLVFFQAHRVSITARRNIGHQKQNSTMLKLPFDGTAITGYHRAPRFIIKKDGVFHACVDE